MIHGSGAGQDREGEGVVMWLLGGKEVAQHLVSESVVQAVPRKWGRRLWAPLGLQGDWPTAAKLLCFSQLVLGWVEVGGHEEICWLPDL